MQTVDWVIWLLPAPFNRVLCVNGRPANPSTLSSELGLFFSIVHTLSIHDPMARVREMPWSSLREFDMMLD